jgi:hypothetical protein
LAGADDHQDGRNHDQYLAAVRPGLAFPARLRDLPSDSGLDLVRFGSGERYCRENIGQFLRQ